MNRRTFLAAGVAGVATATAGCSSLLGSTVALPVDDTGVDGDGREKHLIFRDGEQRIAAVSFDQRDVQETPTDDFRFRISASHDDTKIESFQYDLRAPQTSVDPPADIYLESPAGGLWPDITFEDVENHWTRIALDDTGELGEGTLSVDTIINPNSAPVTEVGIRVEMELSSTEGRRTYTLDTQTQFEPVVTQE
jgi:hypothetical protein